MATTGAHRVRLQKGSLPPSIPSLPPTQMIQEVAGRPLAWAQGVEDFRLMFTSFDFKYMARAPGALASEV